MPESVFEHQWRRHGRPLVRSEADGYAAEKRVADHDAGVLPQLMAVGSTMLTVPVATPKLRRLRALIFKAA
jgi:hypothetical protein